MRPIVTSIACAATIALSSHAEADVVFVNANQVLPTVLQTGQSWAFAYKSLTKGLDEATAGDDIWVANGIYKPTTGIDQLASFAMKANVRVLGGFHSGDGQESQRDPVGNPSILSGELGAPGTADNSMHIVTSSVAQAELDGFVLMRGNADGVGNNQFGGALFVSGLNTDTLVRRCVFEDNQSLGGGGAAAVLVNATPRFVECTFVDNATSGAGGAITSQNCPLIVASCKFLGNSAASNGGAISAVGANGSKFQGSLFSGNTSATGGGGAIALSTSTSLVAGCTFSRNVSTTAGNGGALQMLAGSLVTLSNSILWEDTAGGAPNEISGNLGNLTKLHCDIQGAVPDANGNFNEEPDFINPFGDDLLAGTEDDDLHLLHTSPCIDRGDSSVIPLDLGDLDGDGNVNESTSLELDGNARLIDDIVDNDGVGTQKFLDVGAYEFDRPGTTICVRAGIRTPGDGSTWEKALQSLQAALTAAAAANLEQPVQVWVSLGTYVPTTTTDRNATFTIPAGIVMYGGFPVGAGSLSQRSLQASESRLSGEIGAPGLADNSFHVVNFTGSAVGSNTLIDGFTITGGNSNGGSVPVLGGAIRVFSNAAPVIRNCRLVGNAGTSGGGLGVFNGAPLLVNCLISGNSATAAGAAACSGSTTFANCTILGNTANSCGGVLAQNGNAVSINNTIVYFNQDNVHSGEEEQLLALTNGTFSISYSCVQCLGQIPTLPAGTNSFGADPRLTDADGEDDIFGTNDDLIALNSFSPCIDAGLITLLPPDVGDANENGTANDLTPLDIGLQKRIRDDSATPDGPGGQIDIGAREFQATSVGSQPVLGDLTGDGNVDGADLGALLGAFGTSGPAGDIDNSCFVDAADLAVLLGAWSS